ncbi:MAG: DUF2961 domain-containing protein [Verrucomicrobia bacterium]|nr:DUF2961 domain-containing protein [Verrucomicrobiota bacterium]
MKSPVKSRIVTVLSVFTLTSALLMADNLPSWQDLSTVGKAKTHGMTAFWGGLPELTPKAKITVLDVAGPGVVTSFHVSAMAAGEGFGSAPVAGLILRVFYDGQAGAAIEMPLMDFVGDIECKSQYFTSVFMSKVKESHNFRIPMPFRNHVKIEVENPSDVKVTGYIELTYDSLDAIPAECGTLRVNYRTGNLSAQTPNTMFESGTAGVIVAHWLQYETDKALNGQLICEADQQFFLDGDTVPTLQSMGSEDFYGGSWGFIEPQGDVHYTPVLRHETLGTTGSRIAVLRCRSRDAISFRTSCRWILTWANDGWAATALGTTPIPYRHCVYYYSNATP